jgi:hypothetical protein
VGKRLFYSLAASGDVVYDDRRLKSDNEAREALAMEKEEMEKGEDLFDSYLDNGDLDTDLNTRLSH